MYFDETLPEEKVRKFTYKNKAFELHPEPPHNFLIIKRHDRTPDQLKGMFTTRELAEQAIIRYCNDLKEQVREINEEREASLPRKKVIKEPKEPKETEETKANSEVVIKEDR